MKNKYFETILLPGNFDPLTVGHMKTLSYLSKRSHKVVAVIMTLKESEHKRFIPSAQMKKLIEDAVKEAGLDNVTAYIEEDGWIADTIKTFNADAVARSFHANINAERELEFIKILEQMDIPVQLVPSYDNINSTLIKVYAEHNITSELEKLLPKNVYDYIINNQ